MANNLLSQENVAFISLHCGGDVFETISRTVSMKQQSIVFGTEIIIPVIDEHIITKVGLNNDSRPNPRDSQCFLPVSIRLNRKGLIDSDVIAVGKLMIPQSADSAVSPSSSGGAVSYSVPLINSEDNLEIAVAHITVKSNRSHSSNVGRILSEMQFLLTQFTKSKENIALTDSIERFLGTVTPVRRFTTLLVSALTWEPSWVRSWLFMLTISIHPIGLYVYLLVIALVATNSPFPFLSYLKINLYDNRGTVDVKEDIIAENLAFLTDIVNRLSQLAMVLNRERFKAEILLGVAFMVYLFPISWCIIACMTYQTLIVQAVLSLFIKGKRKPIIENKSTPLSDTGEYFVYENQRWWLGKWSDRLINSETQPWTTAVGPSLNAPEFTPKESFILPSSDDPAYQWKWNGPWSIDTPEGDGWQYAQDFRQTKMHSKRELTDFIRQRRWTRKFTRVKAMDK